MAGKISPLAPKTYPDMDPIDGVRLAAGAAGIKYKGRDDVMAAVLDPGASWAGVFTKNTMPGAPVDWCRARLGGMDSCAGPSVLVVNSGNSNVFTGAAGVKTCEVTAKGAAEAFGASKDHVMLASTGVIGEPLDGSKIAAVLPEMSVRLEADSWMATARSIMTTDTFPKVATASAKIGGVTVRLNGMAKGSGMIAPDMATMLGYIFTDANLPADILQACLKDAVDQSFNAVTVDSDTSTSDMVLLAATRKADHAADADVSDFQRALIALCRELAMMIARDGEGASKFVEFQVTGAESDQAARTIAMSLANSPLVKTAIAGEDANWGRIIMAVGKSGEKASRDQLKIYFGDILVAENGCRHPDYKEAQGAGYFKGDELYIHVDVGIGSGENFAWTCDLTHDYISINADYRS